MPSETFLRLPEEKRNRFIEAAWDEFTSTRFADASINQIIKKARIPRGSFYQYFLDKDDLLAYLLEEVRSHIQEEYRRILKVNGGDIFQAQLDCFDRLASRNPARDPALGRCVSFLRNNRGMDIQKMLPTCPGQRLLDGVWDAVDLSGLRVREPEYGRAVFSLLMAALGSACADMLLQPEDRERCRRELALKLEIVKNGCLSASEIPLHSARL